MGARLLRLDVVPLVALAQRRDEVQELLTKAGAIAAIEILSTDYSATPADGPMYAEATVLKPLKGGLLPRQVIRFGASAWVGPTYKKGDPESASSELTGLLPERDLERPGCRPA